jgi:spore maturation protein CgeB
MNVLAVMPPDRWMEINLLETLRDHYCDHLEVFTYPGGMGRLGSKAWRDQRDQLNEELVRLAKTLKAADRLDLIFFIVYDDFLLVDTARQLRALQVPMINYHVDMAFQWYRVIRTAPYFDVLAVAQLTNSEHLKRYNDQIVWMPMAANPKYYAPKGGGISSGYQQAVSFVGSFNPYRRALLKACVQQGIKPVVFGRGWQPHEPRIYEFDWDLYKVLHDLRYYAWPRWLAEGSQSLTGPVQRKLARRHLFHDLDGPEFHPPCTDEALPDMFRSSCVNLGFSDTGWHADETVLGSNNLQCRLRDFEVPMSGGFYLVQRAPDHEEYYRLGREIETWSEPGELVEKALFYSRHPREAERIREAGHARVFECHTWRHRFDDLFKQCELTRRSMRVYQGMRYGTT